MTSTKKQTEALPEPMALTPEQLTGMAAATAGGLSLVASLIIRCGGYPPFPTYTPSASATTLAM